MKRAQADGGFATVWAASAVISILTVFSLLIWLGTAAHARHRAAAAADLAALAAAAYARDGPGEACERAGIVADAMAATLESCRLRGWDAMVEVSVAPGGPLSVFGAATGRARAGPA